MKNPKIISCFDTRIKKIKGFEEEDFVYEVEEEGSGAPLLHLYSFEELYRDDDDEWNEELIGNGIVYLAYDIFNDRNKDDMETVCLFSNAFLHFLQKRGIFQPNKYNNNDGNNDVKFLLEVSENFSTLSDSRKRKLKGLLYYTIKPFCIAYVSKSAKSLEKRLLMHLGQSKK